MARVLETNTTLTQVNLAGARASRVRRSGSASIAHPGALSDNGICHNCSGKVFAALMYNTTITDLDLRGACAGDAVRRWNAMRAQTTKSAMMAQLSLPGPSRRTQRSLTSPSLVRITFCCCLATPTHCFVHHARRPSKVRAPLLPDTEIEQDGATELARSLANNMAVTTITLTRMWPRSMQQHVISDFRKSLSPAGAGNSIGASGATALAAALRTNATITDVTISGAQAVWVTILQRCTVC